MEDFRSEVATEEAPRCPVLGGAYGMLVAVDDFNGRESGWAVGVDGTVLDQGLVGENLVSDEDGKVIGTDMESDDRTVLGMEVVEDMEWTLILDFERLPFSFSLLIFTIHMYI